MDILFLAVHVTKFQDRHDVQHFNRHSLHATPIVDSRESGWPMWHLFCISLPAMQSVFNRKA
jgi:hypothetical protein